MISAGPGNESSQTLTFLVSNDNNTLFATQPAISPDGTLTYETALNANGNATVTVKLQDNETKLNYKGKINAAGNEIKFTVDGIGGQTLEWNAKKQ